MALVSKGEFPGTTDAEGGVGYTLPELGLAC
jgi:hypothetical protein